MFSSMNHGPNDHRLLVLSLQLHLRALKHDTLACQGLWDGALLREAGRWVVFGWEVGNRFVVLPSRAFDPEEEWGCFVMVVFVAAAKTIGTQGPVWRSRLGLSPGTLELIVTKQATHLARLSCLHSATAHVTFCLTNMRVKSIVSCDAQAYVKQQADQAKWL
jgi:hypothetical protein